MSETPNWLDVYSSICFHFRALPDRYSRELMLDKLSALVSELKYTNTLKED